MSASCVQLLSLLGHDASSTPSNSCMPRGSKRFVRRDVYKFSVRAAKTVHWHKRSCWKCQSERTKLPRCSRPRWSTWRRMLAEPQSGCKMTAVASSFHKG